MKVTKDGQFYKVWRVTGPHHNFLALSLAQENKMALPKIEGLTPVAGCNHGLLDPEKILHAVMTGVEEANFQLGTNYQVSSIQYVTDDTPPEITYSVLAIQIIKSVHNEVAG